VRRNARFSGGWTVRRFADHAGLDAVQIELNQRRYLILNDDESWLASPPADNFDVTQQLLRTALETVASEFWAFWL
jgi:N-formylglutamate amidohydrolase